MGFRGLSGCFVLCVLQDSEITHVSDTIDLAEFVIEDSYTGPRMEGAQGLARPGGGGGLCVDRE